MQMSSLRHMVDANDLPIQYTDLNPQKHTQAHPDLGADQHSDDYRQQASTAQMPPGQIEGTETLNEECYVNGYGRSPFTRRSSNFNLLHLDLPGCCSPAELAISAMQYLPYPLMVLNSLKTLVLANEAMGRLLDIEDNNGDTANTEGISALDKLRGKTLSQMGIDMLQDGRPVWVTWESFLDSLADEMGSHVDGEPVQPTSEYIEGDETPTAGRTASLSMQDNASKNKSIVHDAVVEVILTPADIWPSVISKRTDMSMIPRHTVAKMIITIWEANNERFFTLSFTSASSSQTSLPGARGQSRQVTRSKTRYSSVGSDCSSSSTPSSISSLGSERRSSSYSGSCSSPTVTSPAAITMSWSEFPPLGPPSRASNSSAPSILQKIIMMKDALLDNTQVPVLAMWKDGSLAIPNRAARRLFHQNVDLNHIKDASDWVSTFHLWDETFTTKLEPSEYPISVLTRTQEPFKSRVVGIIDPETGGKLILDCLGEAIRDENTGEFLAGIVTGRDITSMREQIDEIRERDEQRFQLICNSMPQMIWTATSEGLHDWFSWKWYEYTGLAAAESLGMGWKLPVHPDDLPSAEQLWAQSLSTGVPYSTEYRCRSKNGEWRWMLGRALPIQNKHTGLIEKWFGTCTDIHEAVESRFAAKRTRQQLLSVINHAQVTLFSVDRNRNLNLLEGAAIWRLASEHAEAGDQSCGQKQPRGEDFIGRNAYDVFCRVNGICRNDEIPLSLRPIEDIFAGKMIEHVQEHCMDNRWYRTKFVPILGKSDDANHANETFIDGVIGVSMEITELKAREAALQMQEKENTRLQANEAAAKEASRLKSQFLANMSHEIRTPIAGVIGMAELLTDMNLTEEQQECAENIQRSGNGLLTVINDILDFSKVESGRLDIEEVRFSLSVVVQDVSKMLRFAAERKSLVFESNIDVGVEKDLVVLGDPGRVRQIVTNLLTNSIKFTSEGRVKFSVLKERDTADIFEVKFVVEDTGIGIEEEVQKRLFKPFSQADSSTARRFGGTGLGLTISKNLVDLMHGRIQLKSSLGSGTTATFWIPFNKPQFRTGIATITDAGHLPDRLQSEMSFPCSSSDYEHVVYTAPVNSHMGRQQRRKSRSMSGVLTSPSDFELPYSDRVKINVLVVEDNAINQKIALKTIRKFGFIVSAVWNGKEALDYLLESDGPNPQHAKPDIILMDVQMPIIDGYRATHLIRHHSPYKSLSRNIPIVAMTASAIQGDREKCSRAGMDDYLAKPVKGKTLEKMLVRWAITRRMERGVEGGNYNATACSDLGEYDCDNATVPLFGQLSPASEKSQLDLEFELSQTTMTDRRRSQHLTLPGTESEGDRAERRKDAEEKATALRDDKLIVAAGGALDGLYQHAEIERSEYQKLTVENMGKLEMEANGTNSMYKRSVSSMSDSMRAEAGTVSLAKGLEKREGRPKVERRWRDSERTLTASS